MRGFGGEVVFVRSGFAASLSCGEGRGFCAERLAINGEPKRNVKTARLAVRFLSVKVLLSLTAGDADGPVNRLKKVKFPSHFS
jgi:hypothetical protein